MKNLIAMMYFQSNTIF